MSDLGWFVAGWAGLSLAVWALPASVEALMGRRLAPGLRTFLWLAVMLRVVVPFGLLPVLPASAAFEAAEPPADQPGSGGGPLTWAGPASAAVPPSAVGLGLWALGFGALVLCGIPARRRWALARKASLPVFPAWEALASDEAPGFRVRCVPGLRSPGLAGLVRPTIYLPHDPALPADDLRWMLRHEASHARRGDLWVLAAARGLALLFWFLPGLWLALGRLGEALEAGCDARTLRGASAQDRRAYGGALLRLLGAPGPKFVPVLAMATGFGGLKRRLGAIRRPHRTTGAGLVVALAALAAGGVWGLPAGSPPVPGWPFAPGTQAWVTLGYGPVSPEMHLRITDHRGIDLAARSGTPVLAPWGGTVTSVETNDEDGNLVVLDIGGGWTARLTHLKAPAPVAPGTRVAAGTPVGLVGSTGVSTGPHVHVEVLRDGVPTDPAPFLSP